MRYSIIIGLLTLLVGCSSFSSSGGERPDDSNAQKPHTDISEGEVASESNGGKPPQGNPEPTEIKKEEPHFDKCVSPAQCDELPSAHLNTSHLAKIYVAPLNCETRDNLVFPDGTIVCFTHRSRWGYDIAWLKDGEITSTYRAPQEFRVESAKFIDGEKFVIMGHRNSEEAFLQVFDREREICDVSLGVIESNSPWFVFASGSVVLREHHQKDATTSVSWFRDCTRVASFSRQFVSHDGSPGISMSAPIALPDGRIVVTSVENVEDESDSFRTKMLWLNNGNVEHEVRLLGHYSRDNLMPSGSGYQSITFFSPSAGYYTWYRNGVLESEFFMHQMVTRALPLMFEDELHLVDEGSNTLISLEAAGEKCRQTISIRDIYGLSQAKYRQLPNGATVILTAGGEAIWVKNCAVTARLVLDSSAIPNYYRLVSEVYADGSFIVEGDSDWKWVRDGVQLADFGGRFSSGMTPIYVEKDTILMQDPDAIGERMAWIRLKAR